MSKTRVNLTFTVDTASRSDALMMGVAASDVLARSALKLAEVKVTTEDTDPRERLVALLSEVVGGADTFEARDEARELLSKAWDEWAKRTQGDL
jgi:hypothetical protein